MKISLIAMLLLCLSTSISFGQEETRTKRSEFGISVGANAMTSSVKALESMLILDGNFKSEVKPGFSLGILHRYRLSNLLVLRTQAELSFTETEFYLDSEFVSFTNKREMVNIELPIHLVFEKNNKKRTPSAFVGGRYRYDVGGEEIVLTDENGMEIDKVPLFQRNDLLLDVGIGMAFKMEHFTFKPEFVYSRGLLNQKGELDMIYESIYSNQFSLRFVFYGS